MPTIIGETCVIKPQRYIRKNAYFSQLDMIRENRKCPIKLTNGNYQHEHRACPCNKLPFQSYAEYVKCSNLAGGRDPCNVCS